MFEEGIKEIERKMGLGIEALSKDFMGLRTGRASPAFLDPVKVDSYGSLVPINQVANVNAPESNLITVQVWDKSLVKAVEKAIREASLGVSPAIEGDVIRLRLPALTQERRSELSKLASKYAEEARIVIRNLRREGMEAIKKLEKKISEDEARRFSDELQKKTDAHIKKIDQSLEQKQKDIMHV